MHPYKHGVVHNAVRLAKVGVSLDLLEEKFPILGPKMELNPICRQIKILAHLRLARARVRVRVKARARARAKLRARRTISARSFSHRRPNPKLKFYIYSPSPTHLAREFILLRDQTSLRAALEVIHGVEQHLRVEDRAKHHEVHLG